MILVHVSSCSAGVQCFLSVELLYRKLCALVGVTPSFTPDDPLSRVFHTAYFVSFSSFTVF